MILLRLDEDEDVLVSLKALSRKERIQNGLFVIIGSLKMGSLVSGAETEDIPVVPIWHHVQDNYEVLGIGNIFQSGDEPQIHLHAALGRGEEFLMGCLRESSKVFLVAEIIVFELLDISGVREKNGITGLSLLKIR